MTPKIKTDFIYPPIPSRDYDWCAWYAGEEDEQMDVGYGTTEQEAIHDLLITFPRD